MPSGYPVQASSGTLHTDLVTVDKNQRETTIFQSEADRLQMGIHLLAERLSSLQSVLRGSEEADLFSRFLQKVTQANDVADLHLCEIGWIEHLRISWLPVEKHRDDAKHKREAAKDKKGFVYKSSHAPSLSHNH